MSKPTKPAWAYGDTDYREEPDAGKQATGWVFEEKPPFQYFNWIHFQSKAWIDYQEAKAESQEPVVMRSAGTLTWSGTQLSFASAIDIAFNRTDGGAAFVNRIGAGSSPISLSDGQVVVIRKIRTGASPVTITNEAVYANLGAGEYCIVAESSLTSTNEEYETVIFRRNGSDLEIPCLGMTIPTGTTFSLSKTVYTHDTSMVTSGTFADARIAQSNVTQHQAALTIAETQITDGSLLARVAANETITGRWLFNDTTLTTQNKIDVTCDTLTSGNLFRGYTNTSDTGAGKIFHAIVDNAAAAGIVCFKGTTDSTQTVFEGDVGTPSGDYRAVYRARFTGNTNKAGFQVYSDTGGDVRGFFGADNTNGVYIESKGSIFFQSATVTIADFNSTGGLLLPDVDPPVANRMYRQSGAKAFLAYTDGTGVVTNSFNIDAVTDDDGDGEYFVSLDTNFAASNYTVLLTAVTIGGDEFGNAIVGDVDSITVTLYDVSNAAKKDDSFFLVAYGTQ